MPLPLYRALLQQGGAFVEKMGALSELGRRMWLSVPILAGRRGPDLHPDPGQRGECGGLDALRLSVLARGIDRAGLGTGGD